MDQRGAAKQAHLRQIGRAHARLAPFALNALDHGGLFTADVGPRAPAQLDLRQLIGRVGAQLGQLMLQHGAAAVVLVTQIDSASVNTHHPGCDQQPFQKPVRVALQIGAVLEGAGLALVNVHGHQARRGLLAHDAPFAPGGKTGPTQPAQAGVFHAFQHMLHIALAPGQRCGERVAPCRAVGFQPGVARRHGDGVGHRRHAALHMVRRYKFNSARGNGCEG